MSFLNYFNSGESRLCNNLSEAPAEQPNEIEEGVDRILEKPAMKAWMKSLETKMAEAPPEKITDQDVEDMSEARIKEVDGEILIALKEALAVPTKYAKVTNPKTGQTVEFPFDTTEQFRDMMGAFNV